ncbi:6-cysteine protein, putative [Plasmodium relictum]|uniref:Cysteine-rich surface protein, putative n=1 Tax=Plasmodium relictum TaxID=85471 RepID=A0A1J1H833_PLARL|nr:6-cysteine protein, putative [Plasmodium relictum]CRH00717.1 6-cysteine protein, putative [Plasmodium relictum]
MLILKFFFVLLLSLKVKYSCGEVTFENTTVTNLEFPETDKIFYTNVSFKGKIYAFKISNDENCTITVNKTSDGTTWENTNEIKKEEENNNPTIFSIFVKENKLIVIFRCQKYYIAKAEETLVWSLKEIEYTGFDENALPVFYSGPMVYINIEEKIIMFCMKKTTGDNNIKAQTKILDTNAYLLIRCAISNDEGLKWENATNIYTSKEINDKEEIRLSKFEGKLLVKVSKETLGEYFLCDMMHQNNIYCISIMPKIYNTYSLKNLEEVNNYIFSVAKKGKYFYPCVIYNRDEVFKPNENNKIEGSNYEFIFANKSNVFLFYGKSDNKVHVIKITAPTRKMGCELTENNQSNKKYTYAFTGISNKKVCEVPSSEIGTTEDGSYKIFYVKLPHNIELTSDCFSFPENGVNETKTILVKKNINDSKTSEKEIEFFYPVNHIKFLFAGYVYCILSNNYEISLKFDDMRNFTDISYIEDDSPFSVYSNDILVFPSSKNYPTNTYNLPKGSYSFSLDNYINYYVISNLISSESTTNLPSGGNETKSVRFIKGGKSYSYEGIDLTDSSPNYKLVNTNITEDKTIDVIIAEFNDEKTVGLVCPLSQENFECFHKVYNNSEELVRIEEVFDSEDIFVFPTKLLYKGDETALETILHLNKRNVDKLNHDKNIVHFHCRCQVNNHSVKVYYHISAHHNEEFIQNELNSQRNVAITQSNQEIRENVIENPLDPNKSSGFEDASSRGSERLEDEDADEQNPENNSIPHQSGTENGNGNSDSKTTKNILSSSSRRGSISSLFSLVLFLLLLIHLYIYII